MTPSGELPEGPPARTDPETFATVVRHAPLVSIDLIVQDRAGRVLLGLRANAPARGTWFVPGGAIRKGERIADAFRRVASGELGADLSPADAAFAGVHEHFYPDNFAGRPGFGTHYVVLAYRVAWPGGETPAADAQHRELRWWEVGALRGHPAVHRHVKAYFPPGA